MRVVDHRKAGARLRLVLMAGIALATVAVLPHPAVAADEAALEEYVFTPPGVNRQNVPSTQPGGDERARASERPGVLAQGEPAEGPVKAAAGAIGQVPPALLAASAVLAGCLLVGLIAAKREHGSFL